MLTIRRSEGATGKFGSEVVKGKMGRHEWFAKRDDDGQFRLCVNDFGNYGKLRHFMSDPVTEDQLWAIVRSLQDLLHGEVSSTHVPFQSAAAAVPEAPEPLRSAPTAPASVEPPFGMSDGEMREADRVRAEAEENATEDEFDQLTA